MMNKYEIIIHWSDEDQSYIADVPELLGCMAHGDTYESALTNIKEAMDLWIETAREFNDPIPSPKGRRLAFA
jgi:predicted RNase H-like HicB family nuclease